ncbi:MAG: threonine synthase [Trueperaceae bacterium]|nr:MAG: threonine synthase [Trueperaceae bacterium]
MTGPSFRSTRSPDQMGVPFREALLRGLAPDGGLYYPDSIPQLEPSWEHESRFEALASQVLHLWLAEAMPERKLVERVEEALHFPVPLVDLPGDCYLLELFHGPTLSFKDFGARVMARLMSYFLEQLHSHRTILVATSGDTGSAVADGFSGQENIDVVLLYPQGMVSRVQERQLIVARPGVRAFAVDGTFDDCQRLVKNVLADRDLFHLGLSSANSINIGRLLPQTLYYLWGARVAAMREVSSLNVCVPCGNLGNLTGGVLASLMGLPIKRFLAAHNANDYFPKYLHGRVAPFAFESTVATLSNAMDVGSPSNFERLYTLLKDRMRDEMWGVSVDDDATLGRIKQTYEEAGVIVCPHTAVGLEAVARYRQETGDMTPTMVLATAHPAKFPEVIQQALHREPPRSEVLDALWSLPTSVESLEPKPKALQKILEQGIPL